MKSALCKMLAVVILFLSSLSPAFSNGFLNDNFEYLTECRQIWNPRYEQIETVCERVYTGRRENVGPYDQDGYCCTYGFRPNPYHRNGRFNQYRGRGYYDRRYDRHGRYGVQFNLRW